MPNWCTGEMIVTGNYKNLRRFLRRAFPELVKNKTINLPGNNIRMKDFYEIYYESSYRCFLSNIDEIIIKKPKDFEQELSISFDFQQAWGVNTEDFIKDSNNYNLNIVINAEEPGMGFTRYVEIDNGDILTDETEDMEEETL